MKRKPINHVRTTSGLLLGLAVTALSAVGADLAEPTPVTELSVTAPATTLSAGQSAQVTVQGTYSDGHSANLTSAVDYSATGGVSVSASGLVTGTSWGTGTVFVIYHNVDFDVASNISFTITLNNDQDNDGMPDSYETQHGFNMSDPADGSADADGDGLSNRREYELGTDPRNPDTDGDGVSDGAEATAGTDPLALPTLRLDETCTATLLNRSTQVAPDGSYALPGVPVQPGYFRVRVTCVRNGQTITGQSAYFTLTPDGASEPGPIYAGSLSPLPVSIVINAPQSTLNAKGQTLQLAANVTYADGSSAPANGPAQGTLWISSNPNLATVSPSGLVTAVARGTVIITANNEGVQSTIQLTLLIPEDADDDGMTDQFERANGLNPNDPSDAGQDLDGDGLTNLREFEIGSNPRAADSDGDGLVDGEEVLRGTNPVLADTDGDGLTDGQEVTRGSNPLARDTDGDGIADGLEVQLGLSLTTADPTTTVEGRVVDTLGVPVSGAAVTLFNLLTVNCDSAGLFSFPNVPAGLGQIIALAQTVRAGKILDGQSTPVNPVAGGMTSLGTIQIGLNAGTVAGLVTDPFGVAVAGAAVTVTAGVDVRNATTDPTGHYRVSNMTAGNLVVTVRDYRTGLRGRAVGILPLNDAVTINVQLGPFGSVNGTVLNRDNSTPVGAGVNVSFTGGNFQNTMTDPFGRYLFDFIPLGSYSLLASDTANNKGRSSGDVSASSQVNVNDIAYLGRGHVVGVVRDGANAPVAGANVTLNSGSVFGGTANATTDGAGRYAISNIFVGAFSITARAPIARLAGAGNGAILSEGQVVTNNIVIAASGSITGLVYRADGVTPVTDAQVSISPAGLSATTDSEGAFRFDFLPLGNYSLSANDSATGDRGVATASLAVQDEVRGANITLNGQGAVIVTVRDGANNLVNGARVQLSGTTQFGGNQTAFTGVDGKASFAGVFAGGFIVSATDLGTGLSGQVNGNVSVGGTANVTVPLQSFGVLRGVVFQPDGSTPADGITVRIFGQVARSTTTLPDGSYRFETVPTSTYTVEASDAGGLRARVPGVVLATQGQEVVQNLTMIGLGTVQGQVRFPDASPAPNFGVSLNATTAPYTRSLFARTDVNGMYSIAGVPIGSFNETSSGASGGKQYYGSTQGVVTAHAEIVNRDINLGDIGQSGSLVPSTKTLYDANNLGYQLRENAAIQDGSPGNMWGGDFGNNRGAFLLDIIAAGTPNPFTGNSQGTLEDDGRELAIKQNGLAGLNVTRKMFVPKDGYFVRYLEILENPSGSPITVDVRLTSYFRFISKVQGGFQFDREPRIVSTSSGDAMLDLAVARDRWVVIDDDEDADPFLVGSSLPTVADVFDGAGGATEVGAADYLIDFNARYGRLRQNWNAITVPAGGSVAILHFGLEQLTRGGATASAQRLVQLPPEALAGLSGAERTAVINFAVPADGVSALLALPALNGNINGKTLTGDGVTVIPSATVRFQSASPYFGRTWNFSANGLGQFSFTGNANGSGNAIVVPTDDYTLVGIHPFTGIATPPIAGDFSPGLLADTQDVIFADTGNLSGNVRRHNGVVASSGSVQISGGALLNARNLGIAANGTFALNGLPAGLYTLVATVPSAQGSALTATITATVMAGQTISADIQLPPTGTIAGTVRRQDNSPAVSATVQLQGTNNLSRSTITDTGGRFTFNDVPVGPITLDAFDPLSNTAARAQSNSVADVTTTVDLTLISGGTVAGRVILPGNQPVSGAQVTLMANNGSFVTPTGPDGRYEFNLVQPGPVSVSANDSTSGLRGMASGTLNNSGQTLTLDMQLFASGTVTGRVYRTDGVTPIPGASVVLSGSSIYRTMTADANGRFNFEQVNLGSFTATATDPVNNERVSVNSQLSVNLEVRTLNLIVLPNITINDVGVVEGNVGSTSATFTVSLSSPSLQQVQVNYNTANFSAVSGDYVPASGTTTFAPGVTAQPLSVTVNGDVSIEPDETFRVNLSGATGGTITDSVGVGTVLNDDGFAGQVDHFVWSAVSSPQFQGEAFPVTVTAQDAFNTTVNDFGGTVNLTGISGDLEVAIGNGSGSWNMPLSTFYHDARLQTIYLASEIGGARTITGLALEVTALPGQTLNNWTIRLKHTPVSSYGVSPGWETGGWTTVLQSNLNVSVTGWVVFNFATPFDYNGVDNLMVDFSFNNNFRTSDGYVRSTDTGLNRSIYFRTDSFYGDPLNWTGTYPSPYVIARIPNIRLLGQQADVVLTPLTSGNFVNGVWSGNVTIQTTTPNVALKADDGDGHTGTSASFGVFVRDDISLRMSDSPDPVSVGELLTYSLEVTNTGPGTATGVMVTNTLPPGVLLESAVASQGTVATNGSLVTCDLGSLAGGSIATITLSVRPTAVGNITNRATVVRGEVDPNLANNNAAVVTTVLAPMVFIDDLSVLEGNVGTNSAVFTVRLSYPRSESVTVNYVTSNGTAQATSDYVAAGGVVTFPPNTTTQMVTVPIRGDTVIEPNETFFVNLSNPVNASLADAQGMGTILNDDGLPGGIARFEWDMVGAAQYVNEPFAATVRAIDAFGNPAVSFSGTAYLTGSQGGTSATNRLLGDISHFYNSSGNYTLGYSFTPNKDLYVTHVRHYFGSKVSIWTDAGDLLVAQPVVSVPGQWIETQLATPVLLQAGTRYRIAAYTGGNSLPYYWRTDGLQPFLDGTLHTGYETSGDAFPYYNDSVQWWLVDLVYGTGTQSGVAIFPSELTGFVNGVWTGSLTVTQNASSLIVRADDHDGHFGSANPIWMFSHNDLIVSLSDSPDPIAVGNPLIYEANITNTGPSLATSVQLTDIVPGSASIQSVAVSHGSSSKVGNTITWDVGDLPPGLNATATIAVIPTAVGNLANSVSVTRGEADADLANNSASVQTTVLLPALTIDDSAAVEGNSGFSNMLFNVRLSYPSSQNVVVNYYTESLTAQYSPDFLYTNSSLVFTPGQTNKTIAIAVRGDLLSEGNETFRVWLYSPQNATLARDQAIGTIVDDEIVAQTVLLNAEACVPSNGVVDPGEAVTLELFLRNPLPTDVGPVTATLLPGMGVQSPSAPQDYGVLPGTGDAVSRLFSFVADGACGDIASVQLQLQTGTNDLGVVTFNVPLGVPTPVQMEGFDSISTGLPAGWSRSPSSGTTAWVLLTTNFNDTPMNVMLCPDTTSFASSSLTTPLWFVSTPNAQLTFRHAYNSAVGQDYGRLQIAIQSVSGFTDIISAGGKFVTGSYSNGYWSGNSGGYITSTVILPPQATGRNVQFRWTFSNNSSLAGSGWFVDSVALLGSSCCLAPGAVDLAVQASDSPDPATVVNLVTYSITVSNRGPGEATGVIVTDVLPPGSTFFGATASGGVSNFADTVYCNMGNLSAGSTATATVQILARDTIGTMTNQINVAGNEVDYNTSNNTTNVTTLVNLPRMAVNNTSLSESVASTTPMVFLVTLNGSNSQPVSVSFATSDSSAVAGLDYIATNGVLVFNPGEVGKLIEVTIIDDALNENSESLGLSLFSITNATFSDSFGTGTIFDDDPLPTLSISDAVVTEGNVGSTGAVFNVTLSAPSGRSVSVNYGTASGTAESGFDFAGGTGSLSFAPGETNKQIVVSVLGETTIEADENFFVNLTSVGNAALGDATGEGTILNDDGLPGQIHRFAWSPLAATQVVGTPFAASVTALDAADQVVSNFNGVVSLRALAGGEAPITNNVLGGFQPPYSSSGTFTLGYSFTPNTNILVTHIRHIFGTKVSIWTDDGAVVASQTVVSSPGTWLETPLLTPVELIAGQTYRVAAYSGGGSYYYGYDGSSIFAHGTIVQSYEASGDTFPTSTDSVNWWAVDLKYTVGNGQDALVEPTQLSSFVDGVWSGQITVGEPGEAIRLVADDGDGHRGTSDSFDAILVDDVSVSMSGEPDTVPVGGELTYTVIVSNSGPSTLSGVMVTNFLPPEVYVDSWSSPGVTEVEGSTAVTTLGDLGPGATQTIVFHTRPHADGTLVCTAVVTRNGGDPYSLNNTAQVETTVPGVVQGFQIVDLLDTGAAIVEHNYLTGDDHGGIATSPTHVFYSGDNETARFPLNDLAAGSVVPTGGNPYEAFFSDLRTGTLYSLADDVGLLPYNGGTATRLALLDGETGVPTGSFVPLSEPVTLNYNSDQAGIFAGYGRVVLRQNNDVYSVALPSGIVTFLGTVPYNSHNYSETWAYWGVAEEVDGVTYLVYVDGSNILRTRVPDGETTVVHSFLDLSDMASITVSVPLNRWYFHHEYESQFGGSSETLGYADALFAITTQSLSNDLAVLVQASPSPVEIGEVLTYTITVTNSGPDDATSVVVSNWLPAEVSVNSISSSQGGTDQQGSLIVCDVGTLGANESATITIEVVPAAATLLSNRTEVARAEQDFYTPNNFATTRTLVVTPPLEDDVAITGELLPPFPVVGNFFTIELHVTNSGPSTASSVTVSNWLPAGLNLDGVYAYGPNENTVTIDGDLIVIELGNLGGGQEAFIDMDVLASNPGAYTNLAQVIRGEPDFTETNNLALNVFDVTVPGGERPADKRLPLVTPALRIGLAQAVGLDARGVTTSERVIVLTLATQSGVTYELESSSDLNADAWEVVDSFTGNGSQMRIKQPLTQGKRFYRVRAHY